MKGLKISMFLSKFKYFFLAAGWLTVCPLAIQAQPSMGAVSNSVAKPYPTSAEQLRSDIVAAIKAKDAKALGELFCWKDVPEERKTGTIENALPTWFEFEGAKVTLSGLDPGDNTPKVVNGISTRPNIPILGWIQVTTDQWGDGNGFPYGKFGDRYYLASWIHEPVKK